MINQITFGINNMSQVLSFFLGILVLILGTYVILTGNHPSVLVKWSLSILGLSFVICLSLLIFFSLFCIFQLYKSKTKLQQFWLQTGIQLSNGISTLALTYTLLGISLGIGELSMSKLDISSINETIGNLTNKFSMAFLTSVIGLPLSAFLKSILIIIHEKKNVKNIQENIDNKLIEKRSNI